MSVRPDHIEAALRSESQLPDDFFHAAWMFLYHSEYTSRMVVDRICDRGNETSDIDQLLATI
eukprot:185359-Pyramimonas_sp.AAC.1